MDSPPPIPEDLEPEDLQTVREVPAGPISFPKEEIALELLRILEGLDSLEASKKYAAAIQRVGSRERQLLEWWLSDMLPGRIPAPPAKRPSLPNAFPQGVGKVHNNPAVKAAFSAINHGGRQALNLENGWKKTGSTFTFQMNQQGGGTITCFIQGPRQDEEQSIEKYSPERQLDVIQGFGGLTLDVVLAILATMTAPPNNFSETSYPRPGRVMISPEHLLRYKGFGRRGQDRLLLEQQIQREMERVSSLWMLIAEYRAPAQTEGKNPKTRGFDTMRETTPLFEMTKIELGNQSLFPLEDLRVEHTIWEVGVGSWGRAWWNHDNGTSTWVRNASQALIELPHTQPGALLAKKLALGAFICAGKNPAQLLKPMNTTVGELLRNHVGLPTEEARGVHWASRERERLEAAVELLVGVGILERAEWPDGYGPADVARTKSWSNPWLAARITLYPAQLAPEQPALGGVPPQLHTPARPRAKQPRASRKPRRKVARFAVDAKMARAVKEKLTARRDTGLPQGDTETLANHLGISRSHLSNALGGRFHLSRDVYAALERFLKTTE